MQVMINLDDEQFFNAIYSELEDTRDYFVEQLEVDNPAIFSMNEAYDKIVIAKHVEAFDLVMSWYKNP
jgi:hypothetical protein